MMNLQDARNLVDNNAGLSSQSFEVVLPAIDGVVTPVPLSVEPPLPSCTTQPLALAGTNINFPSETEVSEMSMSFLETQRATVLDYASAWFSQVVTSDGSYGHPSNYKKTVVIKLASTNASPEVTITATGVFPTGYSNLELAYDSGDLVRPSIEFSVDNVIIQTRAGSGNTYSVAI